MCVNLRISTHPELKRQPATLHGAGNGTSRPAELFLSYTTPLSVCVCVCVAQCERTSGSPRTWSQRASPLGFATWNKATTGSRGHLELLPCCPATMSDQPRCRLTALPGVLISLLPDLTTKLDQASQQGIFPTSRLAVRLGTLSLLP